MAQVLQSPWRFLLRHLVRREIRPRDVEVENGLAVGLVPGVKERQRFGFVFGAETDLFAGGGVFAVEHARAAKQNKPLCLVVFDSSTL